MFGDSLFMEIKPNIKISYGVERQRSLEKKEKMKQKKKDNNKDKTKKKIIYNYNGKRYFKFSMRN